MTRSHVIAIALTTTSRLENILWISNQVGTRRCEEAVKCIRFLTRYALHISRPKRVKYSAHDSLPKDCTSPSELTLFHRRDKFSGQPSGSIAVKTPSYAHAPGVQPHGLFLRTNNETMSSGAQRKKQRNAAKASPVDCLVTTMDPMEGPAGYP